MNTHSPNTCTLLFGSPRSGLAPALCGLERLGLSPLYAKDDLYALHETLLQQLRVHWAWIGELPPGWLDSQPAKRAAEHLAAILRQAPEADPGWVFADPRLCRLLPLWTTTLEALDIRMRLILVIRDPRECAQSLERLHGFSYRKSALLWQVYTREAVQAAHGLGLDIITYNNLVTNPLATLQRLAESHTSLPVSSDCLAQAAACVVPALRNYHFASEPTEIDPVLSAYTLLRKLPQTAPHIRNYSRWRLYYEQVSERFRPELVETVAQLPSQPLVSLLLLVHHPEVESLSAVIGSVLSQCYDTWELFIVAVMGDSVPLRQMIAGAVDEHPNIQAFYAPTDHSLTLATNTAVANASGELVVLLDQDHLLSGDALLWLVDANSRFPDAALFYFDEDQIIGEDIYAAPHFKPDVNYELLLAYNYFGDLCAYRRTTLKRLGFFDPKYEAARAYDLNLRIVESLPRDAIIHIPRVLYHKRAVTATPMPRYRDGAVRLNESQSAVRAHLGRHCPGAKVEPAPGAQAANRVRFPVPVEPPLVTILIPTRDRVSLLKICLESVLSRTRYPHFEIIVIDNDSREAATQQFLSQLPKERIRIIKQQGAFNFSLLNNRAAALARGEILCLMNNDIEIINRDWLDEMVSHAVRRDVGCVGARLWYPDGRLQHGGVIIGFGGVAGHAHKHLSRGHEGYFCRAVVHQELSAVTAACLVVRKKLFIDVGGLDERLAVAFNDVDFCLRVRDAGFRNLWTPYAEMFHHESASRGMDVDPLQKARFGAEIRFMQRRWGDALLTDPAYNPCLTLQHEDFSYAWPPRLPEFAQVSTADKFPDFC